MPEQRFSIGETTALLDIDRVTLTRWLEAEGMHPSSDPRDKRYKYLTREQIYQLARTHNRAVRDETTLGHPRLTGAQRDMLARIQRLEEWQAELQHERDERESWRQRALEPRQPVVTPLDIAEYPRPPESHYRPSGAMGARNKLAPGEWATLPPIPAGWVPVFDFGDELGIKPRTFGHALRRRDAQDTERYGTLDYHTGKWQRPHPGNFATELFDEDQQAAARAYFASRQPPTGDSAGADDEGDDLDD